MARLRTRPLTLRTSLHLKGYDGALPPGRYFVETDQGSQSFAEPAYLRILELMPAARRRTRGDGIRSWILEPGDIDDALARGDVVLDAPVAPGSR